MTVSTAYVPCCQMMFLLRYTGQYVSWKKSIGLGLTVAHRLDGDMTIYSRHVSYKRQAHIKLNENKTCYHILDVNDVTLCCSIQYMSMFEIKYPVPVIRWNALTTIGSCIIKMSISTSAIFPLIFLQAILASVKDISSYSLLWCGIQGLSPPKVSCITRGDSRG